MPAWSCARTRSRPPGIVLGPVGGGRYAVYRVMGPYGGIGPAYRRLFGERSPHSGESMADGPRMEIYRNSPMDTSQQNLATELCVPLGPAKSPG